MPKTRVGRIIALEEYPEDETPSAGKFIPHPMLEPGLFHLCPGETIQERFPVRELYDLMPGRYAIQAVRYARHRTPYPEDQSIQSNALGFEIN